MEQPHEHPIEESQRLLKLGIVLTVVIFLLEFLGGLWTHSLALLSDAWHIFIDIWALVLSFLAVLMARRPVNDRQTFGLHRLEVLAAVVNGLTVFIIALGILFAAVQRYRHPVPVHAKELLGVAGIGLALNLGVAALFYRQSYKDLNIRGAFLHVLGDALNTAAVIVAGILILITGVQQIDAIVSAVIAVVVLWGSGRLLRESLNTLLEGVPPGIQVETVEREIRGIRGVESVHDLHVWSICSHLNALSGHVMLAVDSPSQHIVLEDVGRLLRERFGIIHTTIQLESRGWPNTETIERIQHG